MKLSKHKTLTQKSVYLAVILTTQTMLAVAEDRHEETYRKNLSDGNHPETDRKGIAISFGAGIGTDNEFFLNHIYTQTRDVPEVEGSGPRM
ncbi:MAG: hypothetical protein WC009_09225 [Methylotenera sp.]|jgi:outer membrane receptor for monomeric catechols